MTVTRGTTNGNQRGSSYARRARREYLVTTFRADVGIRPDVGTDPAFMESLTAAFLERYAVLSILGVPACRCYRCGKLLTVDTVTVDRIVPGCQGGTYKRGNIRPACGLCNSVTGGSTRSKK